MKMNLTFKVDHSLKLCVFLFFMLNVLQVFGHAEIVKNRDKASNTFVEKSYPFTSTVTTEIRKANLDKSTSFFAPPVITGDLRRFHKLTFTWEGPNLSEEDATYSDYRLDVTFTSPSGKTFLVPGYFAADGMAGETSAIAGNKWRCHFNALELGEYTYEVSFLSGTNIAVGFDTSAGTPIPSTHGDTGSFIVEETNKSGIDLRSKGKLEYVGEHFMQWTTGEYFLKIGSNSPENLFEYIGFDDSNSNRTFPNHINDWNPGDPTWKNDLGKGMIGAINYLSSKGINSQYYVMHRKGEQASPWRKPTESYATYDVSKMDQWQIVFDHMMEKGLMAHLVFSESQNQSHFEVHEPSGDPNFSDKRKIYFREIVARFGYLNAVTFNIGEENGWDRRSLEFTGEEARALTTQQQLNFSQYVDDLIYYDDLVTIHNGHSTTTRIFDNLQGDNAFGGISMQGFFNVSNLNIERSKGSTEQYRNESALSGKKWVVYYDEGFSFDPFPEDPSFFRQNMLWSTLTSGGAGMEHFTTRLTAEDGTQTFFDTTLEDLRYSDVAFTQMKHAYDFYIDNNIPFYEMYNQDNLVENGWVHGDEFENYVMYILPGDIEEATISLTGEYEVKWYNPRTGGALQDGTIRNLTSGEDLSLGEPPSEIDQDWVVYFKNSNGGLVPVTGVELNPKEHHLGVGIMYTLNEEVFPLNADNKNVVWSSSDPSVVTVDDEGTITGIAEGNAVITVTTVDGGFTDEANIIVVENTDTCQSSGSILVERYDNIETGKLSFLLNAPNYPDNPSTTFELTEFEIPKGGGQDSYGVRISGFLCPPETGTYTFWISGDDQVQLSISGDNQFQNANRIAWHDSFTDVQQWDKFPEQRSQEILLFQGQSYYIEALMKEGAFGDHVAVGWRKPSDGPGNEPTEIVPGNVLSTRALGQTSVTDISLNVPNADLFLSETLQLIETILPVNASDKSIVWSSADPSIVSVDQEGNIIGNALGSTVITVTVVEGGLTATATIDVIEDPVLATGISISPTETNLAIGETLVIEATVEPMDATNKEIVWTSDDITIVTVSPNGEISGIAVGTTTINATTVDGNFVGQATINVIDDSAILVTGITITPPVTNLVLGGTLVLEATVIPTDASNKDVIWSSADPSIVTVDANGELLGVSFGTTVITVTTVDGDFTAESTVTVVNDSQINVTGVQLNIASATIAVGETQLLEAIITPSDATNSLVFWSSDDNTIVSVDTNGEILGVAIGTTVITATTEDGNFIAQATITVVDDTVIRVAGISINPDTIDLELESSLFIDATVQPSNASDVSLIWASEDEAIVTVDDNGQVVGVSLGTAIVTATTVDGEFVAQVTITVIDAIVIAVTGIIIDPDTVDLELESSLLINATVQPSNASDISLVWFSEDETIVTVDDNGQVFGVALGTAVVIATTVDGEFVAEVTITVIEKTVDNNGIIAVTGISIEIDDLVLKERDIVQIIGTVLPENASQTFILWVPLDPSIVIVDENGNVVAKKVGVTEITATTFDGGFSKTITVTVLPNNIIVHPNPTSEFINIEGTDERMDIFIYNSSGVLVKTAKGGAPIYVGNLSDSSYVILLPTGDRIRFVKI